MEIKLAQLLLFLMLTDSSYSSSYSSSSNPLLFPNHRLSFTESGKLFKLPDSVLPSFSSSSPQPFNFPLALADVNSDKLVDLIILLSPDSLGICLWNQNQFAFQLDPTVFFFPDPSNPTKRNLTIVNVVPSDFNYDGKMDLLVMAQQKGSTIDDSSAPLFMRIFLGNGLTISNTNYSDLNNSTKAQPLLVDYNGDMKSELLGYRFPNSSSSSSDKSRHLSVWSPHFNFTTENQVNPVDNTTSQMCRFSHPNSNAFIDLNGDCLADMFITCDPDPVSGTQGFEIWLNRKDKIKGFEKKQMNGSNLLPKGAGRVSFGDFDGDGAMDLIFPVCPSGSPDDCFIQILYNRQAPLCQQPTSIFSSISSTADPVYDGKTGALVCRGLQSLCLADDSFSFDDQVKFPVKGVLIKDLFFPNVQVPIRIGDINNDGYPDLLVLSQPNGPKAPSILRIFSSIPCSKSKYCDLDSQRANRRNFEVLTTGTDALTELTSTSQSSPSSSSIIIGGGFFMDIGEDGNLDIVAYTFDESTKQNVKSVILYNNFNNDAFFLKSLVLNGVCPAWCTSGEAFPNPKPYGVNYAGGSIKFTVTDTNGNKRVNAAAQLSQSSYMALQLPYVHSGLGRTNNYIEQFFVGGSMHQKENYLSYQGIIPNSQLVIIPYQPPGVSDPSSWTVELFISPSQYSSYVLIVLCCILTVLLAVVAFLNWNEMREDEREKRRTLSKINYDAL